MTAIGPSHVYRVKSPSVVARVIDGEALLIAFETGAYFSARGSGAAIVAGVLAGKSVSRIIDGFAPTDSFPRAEIARLVLLFVQQLSDEGLVVVDSPNEPVPDPPGQGCGEQGVEVRQAEELAFDPPLLEKYRDLEDLLVLDPIHDVDAAGWPSAGARKHP